MAPFFYMTLLRTQTPRPKRNLKKNPSFSIKKSCSKTGRIHFEFQTSITHRKGIFNLKPSQPDGRKYQYEFKNV